MTPWQRRLRFGLGIFILVFAVVLFFSVRTRKPAPPPGPVAGRDPKAVLQLWKGRLTSGAGTNSKYDIEYNELLTYPNGAMTARGGVKISVPQRAGRDFTVTAQTAETNGDQSLITLRGQLHLTTSDGLVLDTEEASYTNGEGVVRAPGKVTFSKGEMKGTAVGMTYDKNRDVLWLLDQAVIHMPQGEGGSDPADVTAGAAGFARQDHYVRFERGVKMARGAQTIESEGAVAYLNEDDSHVQMLELRGSSRVSGNDPQPGGLRSMKARDINLNYAPGGTLLQHALLSGDGSIEMAGASRGAAGRTLASEWIDISMAPDGTTVSGLVARQNVRLDLPAEKDVPARFIRAEALEGSGNDKEGLTGATFSENVEFREVPTGGARPRVARAASMTLTLKGGFNTIEAARFGGGVEFEDGPIRATARDARYVLATGMLALVGNDERTGRPPQVVDEHATIEARRLDIALEKKTITANEAVKSTLHPNSGGEPGKGTRMPSMLKQDQPVSATADSLVYDSAASRAVYTGRAQLWQGDTAIKADTVTVDDRTGNLSAGGNVVSRMALQHTDEKSKKREPVSSLVTARELVYDDAARRATYTGSVHMNGPEGDLTADRIEIFLTASGDEVERLEAYDNVALKTPEGRKANGTRLTYLAAEGRYTMLGAPVKIIEECRETTGKTLTFFKSADRIIVDGNEQKRTEWKGASNCSPGPRFD